MAEEGKKYVPEGVLLVCDKGSMVSQLFATPRKVTLYGALITTDHDNIFEQNIIPFGACKKLGKCKFAKVQWTMVKEGPVFVNNEKPLLEHSEALCESGDGKIKIYFDEYEANLANENNNESGFVKEDISSKILGGLLTGPATPIIDALGGGKFIEGRGKGVKKGMEATYNFFRHDIWKADTWKGMGKTAVIAGVYTAPGGPIVGDTVLSAMDNLFGTDFVETKDAIGKAAEKGIDNAIEDVKRGKWEEVGENLGQAEYIVIEAIAGSKGANIIAKGLTTTAKTLIGAERLAQIAAKTALFMNKLKMGILGIVRVGRRIPQGLSKLQFEEISKYLREAIGEISDDIAVHGSRAKGTAKATSDIDFAIRVDEDTFNKLIREKFGTPNPGSAKERTMQHAIETGKIQSGEAGLRNVRKTIEKKLGMEADISIIKKGGPFDNPPYIPIN